MAFVGQQIDDTAQASLTCDVPPTRGEASGTLIPIALKTLCPTAVLDFDLYLWANATSAAVLYRKRSGPFTRGDIDRLLEADVQTLYIPFSDHMHYRRYLQEDVVENKEVPPAQRYCILKELNRSVFDAALRGRNLNPVVQFADSHASHLTDIICDREFVLADLFALMDHDYYTYTHATNVCVYSVALAEGLGIVDQADLLAVGTAALLHDIGKRQIPSTILNKPGKLNAEEWDLVQGHPRAAFDELGPRGDLTWDQLMMIYQHHERVDGSGYPVGLKGTEIHEWGRICAIADVFDALTSERPYRKSDPLGKVQEFMQRNAGRQFDKEMIKCWIAITKR